MPELRLVVLAMQDRLVYAPTLEDALAQLFEAGRASRRLRRARQRLRHP